MSDRFLFFLRSPVFWLLACFTMQATFLALTFRKYVTREIEALRKVSGVGCAVSLSCALWFAHQSALLTSGVFYAWRTALLEELIFLSLSLATGCLWTYLANRRAWRWRLLGSVFTGLAVGVLVERTAERTAGGLHLRLYAVPEVVPLLLLSAAISYLTVELLRWSQEEKIRQRCSILCGFLLGFAYIAVDSLPLCLAVPRGTSWSAAPQGTEILLTPVGVVMTVVCLSGAVLLVLVFVLGATYYAQNQFLVNEHEMHRALLDNIPEFMYIKDDQHRFLVANQAMAEFVGLDSPYSMLGKTDEDFYPPELVALYRQQEANILHTGQGIYQHEEPCINRQGEPIYLLTTKVPVTTSDGQRIGIAGIGRDITSRKKMESVLREAELKYRGIFNKAVVGIFQCTPEGRFLSVNPSMAFSFGYASPEEMVESITDIRSQFFADPARGQEFMSVMSRIGGVKNFECEAFCQDGSTIWLMLSSRSIREKGAIIRFEGVCDDISERIQMREQSLHAQKLEAVGQLAAGIAHEINTPTQFIGDNIRFLKDNFAELGKTLELYGRLHQAAREGAVPGALLEQIAEGVDTAEIDYLLNEIPKALELTTEGIARISSIVGAMQEFSHPGTENKVMLDVNHAIESAILVCRNEWKYVAEMETDFDPNLPKIECIPGAFGQVMLNIIVNASHAIADATAQGGPAKGTIRIATRNAFEWVEISIADTGTGIPKKLQTRVFDPFFTTKEIGKGTGQGLSIARSVVVDKHGGSIHLESEMGKGTTFIIRLPHAGKTLPRMPASAR